MGRVFIEEAMQRTGITRTDLVGVLTYLIRTKQATSQGDAINKLESGEFDGVNLKEKLIEYYQVKLSDLEDDEDNETLIHINIKHNFIFKGE